MTPGMEIQLIGCVVAVACALPGVFLVLRGMAMLSDAISHSILLGIVVAFFAVRDITSPFLVGAAAATGVLTVFLVELLHRTRLVREDAAIGLMFPALFSVGVILIARYAGSVHLDTDAVLLGELAFAPFDRFQAFGRDIGPKAVYVMGGILTLNVLFIGLFYKELKLSTFDAGLAAALGFSPVALHYGFTSLVSITAVGAFDAVGSILVVALMIGPAITAYLLTDSLMGMLLLSGTFAVVSAIGGYWIAVGLDASIAGSMATLIGVVFGVVLVVAPGRGLAAQWRRRVRQRWQFAQTMLTIHLFNHEGTSEAPRESEAATIHKHLQWEEPFARRVLRLAGRNRLLTLAGGRLLLTEEGRQRAKEAILK